MQNYNHKVSSRPILIPSTTMHQYFSVLKTIFLLVIIAFGGSVSAQELIICRKYSTVGNPMDISNEWKMDANPKYVSFLYNNGKTTIDNRHINFIFTPITHKDIKADTVKVAIGQSSNWIGTKYGFTAPGDYEVKVMIPNGKVLAKGEVLLKGTRILKEEEPEPIAPITQKEAKIEANKEQPKKPKTTEVKKFVAPAQTTKPKSSEELAEEDETSNRIYPDVTKMGSLGVDLTNTIQSIQLIEDPETDKYFEHLYVQFGREIIANMLMGQNEKFKLEYGGTFIETLFTHTKPLDCEWIGMSLWHKPKGSKKFSVHVEEQRINIKPTDHSAKFSTTYKEKGEYRVTLYTDDLKKIGYAYVNFY